MTFDPTQNRVPTCLLTADELAALSTAMKDNGGEKYHFGEWREHSNPYGWEDIYRAKPAPAPTLSITVNGVTNVVAAPVTEKPEHGTKYYVAAPLNDKWFTWNSWDDDADDNFYLSRRVIHLTEAAARAHAMAMVGLKAEGV